MRTALFDCCHVSLVKNYFFSHFHGFIRDLYLFDNVDLGPFNMSASRRYRKWFIHPGLNIRIPYYTYSFFVWNQNCHFVFFLFINTLNDIIQIWVILKKLKLTHPPLDIFFYFFPQREKEFIIKFTLWIDCWKSFWRVIILLSLFFESGSIRRSGTKYEI